MSAFLQVELTHAPAVSNLYRSSAGQLFTNVQGGVGFDGLGVSAIVLQGTGRTLKGGAVGSLEGGWFFATEKLLTLSEQQVEDCDSVDSARTVGSWFLHYVCREEPLASRQAHGLRVCVRRIERPVHRHGNVLGFDLRVGSLKELESLETTSGTCSCILCFAWRWIYTHAASLRRLW